jgi:hypothetical protein
MRLEMEDGGIGIPYQLPVFSFEFSAIRIAKLKPKN